jgi:hypothetical protein
MPRDDRPAAIGTGDYKEIVIERTRAQINTCPRPQELPHTIHPLRKQAKGIRPGLP